MEAVFGHVAIGSGFKAEQAIFFAVFIGDHDDGELAEADIGADALDEFEARQSIR